MFQKVLIYTTTVNHRIMYIMDLMIGDLVGLDFELTNEQDKFIYYNGPKFNYSTHHFAEEIFFYATGLLFEKKIHKQDITVFDWNETKAFFATHPKYVLPFDPFAAAFYLVTRYEEYLPFIRDKHDRYEANQSVAFQKGFLQKPVVNIYANAIKEILLRSFPSLKPREKKYNFISTIDIDNAWAYRHKGFIRTVGAILRCALNFNLKELKERANVILEKAKDPYDQYDHLFEMQKKYKFPMIYFFLVGDYAENDKNVSVTNRDFQSLIKHISDYYEIGIHPSYASNRIPGRVKLEKSRLQKIVKRDIVKSRQHFLKLRFPDTYRTLLEADIIEDYSMGYANEIGFRAGICTSYFHYDLEHEYKTNLKVQPFAVMDATLRYYMKIRPVEVMSYVGPLIKEVKAVNGTFISLWHNETLTNEAPWEGWREVYEDVIKAALV